LDEELAVGGEEVPELPRGLELQIRERVFGAPCTFVAVAATLVRRQPCLHRVELQAETFREVERGEGGGGVSAAVLSVHAKKQ
jgi:hypothetical protein